MTESDTVRVRIDLAYEGTAFCGWAVQPGLRSVQGLVEQALGQVLRCPAPRVVVAGRTDAGVHARGQVVHVDVPRAGWLRLPGHANRTPAEALPRRLTGVLARLGAQDISVLGAEPAPAGFDARFSALWRRYVYRVADSARSADVLTRRYVYRHRTELDAAAMDRAAAGLIGLHDFAAFCKPRPGATTIRTLHRFGWARAADGTLAATVVADAFCHSMVRALVGACLVVGEGRRGPEWPAAVLARGERDPLAALAPACGLTLEEVGYPADSELAARGELTRALRRPEECCG